MAPEAIADELVTFVESVGARPDRGVKAPR
jgi:hypothetical protein